MQPLPEVRRQYVRPTHFFIERQNQNGSWHRVIDGSGIFLPPFEDFDEAYSTMVWVARRYSTTYPPYKQYMHSLRLVDQNGNEVTTPITFVKIPAIFRS